MHIGVYGVCVVYFVFLTKRRNLLLVVCTKLQFWNTSHMTLSKLINQVTGSRENWEAERKEHLFKVAVKIKIF